MNNKAQLDFDMTTVIAAGLAIVAAFIALIVQRGSGVGAGWKFMTFILTAIVGFFVSNWLLNN